MSENITLDELCKMYDIIIPKPFLEALEKAYTPERCIYILSKSIIINQNIKIIDPNLIDKYLKPKNKITKFR